MLPHPLNLLALTEVTSIEKEVLAIATYDSVPFDTYVKTILNKQKKKSKRRNK